MLIPTGLDSGCFFFVSRLKNSSRLIYDESLVWVHLCFHSILSCGIVFWGGSAFSKRIFLLKKRIVQRMRGYNYLYHFRPLFRKVTILTFPSVPFSDQPFLCVRTQISSLTIVTCINLT